MADSLWDVADDDLLRRFIALRKELGTQAEVANMTGVTTGTISKKERGESPVKARDIAALEQLLYLRNRRVHESNPLAEKVPRGTPEAGPSTPADEAARRVLALSSRLIAELWEMGASDDDVSAAQRALHTEETVRMYKGAPLTPTELADHVRNFESLVTALRQTVKDRIAMRKGAG